LKKSRQILKIIDINFYVSHVQNKFVFRDNWENIIISGDKFKEYNDLGVGLEIWKILGVYVRKSKKRTRKHKRQERDRMIISFWLSLLSTSLWLSLSLVSPSPL